jgi:glucosylceramidase
MNRFLIFTFISIFIATYGFAQKRKFDWVSTTSKEKFVQEKQLAPITGAGTSDVEVLVDHTLQTIDGFGGCFNELGWSSLKALNDNDRQSIMKELFADGVGANFNICRMPIGANDFALKWYSYDETPGDFAMKDFSIRNDLQTLVPFIRSALKYRPNLQLWASPWSPPQWMKYNKHYAQSMFKPGSPYHNGLRPDQVGKGGTNMFIQEEKYFKAYALYFDRFIDAYRLQGIQIGMVMPQNEFLSGQVFPSCTWKASGLAEFVKYLGPQMKQKGVDVFFGTMNNGNQGFVDTALNDPEARKYIHGVGLQWGARNAVAGIHQQYPDLKIYQSEQECGNGKNDWDYCKYCWSLMKKYITNGTNAYIYWNISLPKDGVSTWGWRQNSLVSVDTTARTYTYNYEYYLMKHLSHYIRPGAKLLTTKGDFDNILAFKNPDHSVILVLQNETPAARQININVGGKVYSPVLKADSFNTLLIPNN